jgi:hypothetical protein
MIWYECKQCRKKHGKADNLAGTLVFCECGQGNRVPWSSTIPEPAAPPPRPAESRRRARFDDDEDAPPRPGRPFPPRSTDPEEDDNDRSDPGPAPGGYPLPGRRDRVLRRVRAGFCFNHDEDASEKTCDACRLPFCSRCVVALEGKTLCGPCKNFRISGLSRPSRLLPLAIVAFVVALVSGPVTVFLTFCSLAVYLQRGIAAGPVALSLACLLLPMAGLVLSWKARNQIDRTPHAGGRSLVSSAAAVSLVGALWCVVIAGLLIVKSSQG